MKKNLHRTISLFLTALLLCLSLSACTSTDGQESSVATSDSAGGLLGGSPDNMVEEKDEEYITEDEKWGRVADGMLGNHGEVVKTYNGYLGYGYNMITAAYYNHNDINSGHPVVDMVKLANDSRDLVYVDNSTTFTDPKTYISSSTKEYAKELSTKASLQGNFPLAGSFKANFEIDTSYEMKSNQKLVSLQSNLQTRKDYILGSNSKLLAGYLSNGFIDSVEEIYKNPTEDSIIGFINKYGTHVLTNVTMGGRFDLNYLYTSKSTEEATDLYASLQASYRYVKGSTDTTVETDKKEIEENSRLNIRTYGGSVTTDPRSIEKALESYGKWSERVQAGDVTFIDASEVIPIWDIIWAMGEDYGDFSTAVKKYCEKETTNAFGKFKDTMGVTPPAKTYISDIYIGHGKTSAEAIGMLKNKGILDANIVQLDLNKSAGGNWIYLGYKTTYDKEKAITHILADYYSKPQTKNITSNGYEMKIIDTDLNKKASGKYIYLYYTRDANVGEPITEFRYQFGDNIQDKTVDGYNGVRCYTTGEMMDLNMGTDGNLIYLWFKRG